MKSLIKLSILILFASWSYAQSPIVKKIEFIGNKNTKSYIIEREIYHSVNVPLDTILVKADRQRLENLGIFSLVDVQVFKHEFDEVLLRYTLIESWRYFPMLTPVYEEKWGWSVGAMLMINNFRGRNESFILQGQYGGQNTIGFEFTNPWITGDHISLKLGVGNNVYSHTFLPYDVQSTKINVALGKYFTNSIKTKIGLKLIDKIYSDETTKNNYRHFIPFVKIDYDTRNLYANPSSGIISSNSLFSRLDMRGNRNNQIIWNQSTSYFKELIGGYRNMVAGLNLSSLLSFSKNLDIWYDYVGGAFTVRGWKVPNSQLYDNGDQNYRFGMNWFTASAEIRQVIIPKFATSLNNEFGLSIVAFADIGVIANDINKFTKNSPLIGAGIGVRIPWPIVKSIRLDYGWSFYDGKYIEQSLHFAFGEKF